MFAPIATINGARGLPLVGESMMNEFVREMEQKQGRAANIFLDNSAGPTDLDFPFQA